MGSPQPNKMATNRAIIYGGKGGLGTVIVSHFKSKGWWICSVDIRGNEEADVNVLVNPDDDWTTQVTKVCEAVASKLAENKVDAVINMAGGWAGGSANSPDFIKNADLMWKQSVWSSTISAALAAKHLKTGGCLVLPGAKPALEGTAGMMGYGMAKAAVHQLTKSLGDKKSGLPENSVVLALLPITLDTPMNRKWMPKADTTTWTSLEFVADLLHGWAGSQEGRPPTGSLVQLVTKDSKKSLVFE